ncbi:MAG: Replication factor C small subunit [Methanoregulaceae archaeon PtaB.Bin108]|nr:MAG: Replication factor C small subunit [Methanoregulaceae archaeon PtaB.Bin108]OPY47036.1 MAG: Replication factor C small subunit [Methanoregulaceae archaeon PtaU1.Bin222]
MLWIEKYRPGSFGEIVGQEKAVERLTQAAATRAVPHLILAGPPGTGKSVSVECLSRALYQDHAEENLTVIPTSDLFSLGKKFLESEERYAHLYRADESVLSNFKRIIREYSSLKPLDAEFKLMAFEGASSLPREAQQALRRIMERSSRTCRFIYCTSHPSSIIPAIASRCLPVFFPPIPDSLVESHLRNICSRECAAGCTVPDDQIGLLVAAARGDLRKAVMLLQVAVVSGSGENLLSLSRTETGQVASAVFSALRGSDFPAATRRIETLMIEYGLSGREVLMELRDVVKREFNDPAVACALAETDSILGHSQNEYVQLNALIARLGRLFPHESRQISP